MVSSIGQHRCVCAGVGVWVGAGGGIAWGAGGRGDGRVLSGLHDKSTQKVQMLFRVFRTPL